MREGGGGVMAGGVVSMKGRGGGGESGSGTGLVPSLGPLWWDA